MDTTNEAVNNGAIQRKVDSASDAMHNTTDQAADTARNTVDRMTTTAHETVDKLSDSASSIADRLKEKTRAASEAQARALDFSKNWVQGKPMEAVGAALAIGFLIGRLTSR